MSVVRYLAKLEAEIAMILAHDPDALQVVTDEGVLVLKECSKQVTNTLGRHKNLFLKR